MLKLFLSTAMLMLFFSACSKDLEEYNKPALYWYSQIIENISDGTLEQADSYYSSLQSEHINSPLLPEATIILATAHMQIEEYLLAEHFFNEYIRRYADASEREYAEYMKMKAKYLSLANPRRDQGLINEAIALAEAFEREYPYSKYYAEVDTMLTRLYISRVSFHEFIALLYERIDKPKAAAYYRSVIQEPWIDWSYVSPASSPWYREIFEGDGRGSWYGFLIPDTQSVVSRHSYSEDIENNSTKE